MLNKPRILISSAQEEPVWYRAALEAQGAIPVGGYCPEIDLSCDGLVLCGGGDLDPALFHQPNLGSDPPDLRRDERELALAHAFLEAGKPILGICRGIQVLNVALGGGIIQDLPQTVRPFHRAEGRFQVHPVRAAEGSLFETLYGPVFSVNSLHHQAVGKPGQDLVPVLWSESGVVEGLVHKTLPVLGVQFHPERMTGQKARPDTVDGGILWSHFVSLCQ